MPAPNVNILVTGAPATGKTTLMRRVLEGLPKRMAVRGFYTQEIRGRKGRTGFRLVGSNNDERVFAHVNIQSDVRVGRYGIDVHGFEAFLAGLDLLNPNAELVFVDEIGKMECYSRQFRKLVEELLNAPRAFVATVGQKAGEFPRTVQKRDDALVMHLTPDNRDRLPEEVLRVALYRPR
jgi:nucleoside-triphosphatase THEP1